MNALLVLAWTFTIAQVSDFRTAILYPEYEVHPVGQLLVGDPRLALVAKVLLIAFCCLVAVIVQQRYRYLGHFVLAFGTLAGIVGTWSNL